VTRSGGEVPCPNSRRYTKVLGTQGTLEAGVLSMRKCAYATCSLENKREIASSVDAAAAKAVPHRGGSACILCSATL
jgi:hypothetical protein